MNTRKITIRSFCSVSFSCTFSSRFTLFESSFAVIFILLIQIPDIHSLKISTQIQIQKPAQRNSVDFRRRFLCTHGCSFDREKWQIYIYLPYFSIFFNISIENADFQFVLMIFHVVIVHIFKIYFNLFIYFM